MSVCVTGATGYIGAHVAREASERLGPLRVTYRDERRLDRLAGARRRAGPRGRPRPRRPAPRLPGLHHGHPLRGLRGVAAGGARVEAERARSAPGGRGRRRREGPPRRRDLERVRHRPRAARPRRQRGRALPRRWPGAHVSGRKARGRGGGARRGRAPRDRGGRGEPGLRVRGRARQGHARRDVHAHDRQLPARPAAGGGRRGDERRGRPRRGEGPRARSGARAAGRALRARRTRPSLGRAVRAGGGALGRAPPARRPAARGGRRGACGGGARPAGAGAGRGGGADGDELALLVEQGAPRARLPGAAARRHAARHDRLVPRVDRQRTARRRPAVAAVGGRARAPRWRVAWDCSRPLRAAERRVGRRLVAP